MKGHINRQKNNTKQGAGRTLNQTFFKINAPRIVAENTYVSPATTRRFQLMRAHSAMGWHGGAHCHLCGEDMQLHQIFERTASELRLSDLQHCKLWHEARSEAAWMCGAADSHRPASVRVSKVFEVSTRICSPRGVQIGLQAKPRHSRCRPQNALQNPSQ